MCHYCTHNIHAEMHCIAIPLKVGTQIRAPVCDVLQMRRFATPFMHFHHTYLWTARGFVARRTLPFVFARPKPFAMKMRHTYLICHNFYCHNFVHKLRKSLFFSFFTAKFPPFFPFRHTNCIRSPIFISFVCFYLQYANCTSILCVCVCDAISKSTEKN